MITLTPVDYDPFAEETEPAKVEVPKGYSLTPVDYDPFAEEAQPQPKGQDSKYNVWGGIKDVGKLFYDLPVNTVGALASMWEDENPESEYDWKDIARKAQADRAAQRSAEPGGEENVFPGIHRQDIRDASRSSGFSGVAMGAAAPGMAINTLPVPGARIVGTAAAMAGSGAAAYNMSKTEFTQNMIDAFRQSTLEEQGRDVTPDEVATLVEDTRDLRTRYGLWEAIPEAAGNVAEMTGIGMLFKASLGKFGEKTAIKVFQALAGMYGGELATETITQIGQHNVEVDAGLTNDTKRSFSSPGDIATSFKEVAPQTMVLTTLSGGAGAVAGKSLNLLSKDAVPDDAPEFDQETLTNAMENGPVAAGEESPNVNPFGGPPPSLYENNQVAIDQMALNGQAEDHAMDLGTIQQQNQRSIDALWPDDDTSSDGPGPSGPGGPFTLTEDVEMNQRREQSAQALTRRQQTMGQSGMYQFQQGLEDRPDESFVDVSPQYFPDVADYRRDQKVAASVKALERRQQAMRQPDQPGFQRALESRPDESQMPLPGNMPAFQRDMETYGDGGKFLPFAGLDKKLNPEPKMETLAPPDPERVEDGINVALDAKWKSYKDPDSPAFQRALENKPDERAMRGKPVFEHEVEPDKVNTDPTDAQKEAGNYRKEHIKIDGLNISIENPDGSTRKGKSPDGKTWESTMHGHYGYFKRTMGKDGDQVDVVVKPGTETSPKVFIVDQVDPKTGHFDEHKVVLGTDSEQEAKELYLSNYEKGWQGLGAITELSREEFKTWLKDGKRTTEPLGLIPQGNKPGPKSKEDPPPISEYAPGDPVQWTDKKGNRLTGELIQKVKNNWKIRKENGKTALMPEGKIEKSKRRKPPLKNKKNVVHPDHDQPIGQNQDGHNVYEDENGVRSVEEMPGITVAQKVKIVPGGTSTFDSPETLYRRSSREFLTKEEVETFDKETNPGAKKDLDRQAAVLAILDGARNGGFKNITQARKAVSEKLGIPPIKGGTQEAKFVEEVIEVASVLEAKKIIDESRSRDTEKLFDALADLYDQLPNLSTRTSTSVMNQAYSTPLPLAYVAQRLAGIDSDTTVYEPAAGNGALLFSANRNKTTANELNPDRAQNLGRVANTVTREDGTQKVLKKKVDVVIANPPFGRVKDDAGNTKSWQIAENYSASQIDHAMVFKALESMKDDGRAVFIIGSVNDKVKTPDARKKRYRTGDMVRFYKTLFSRYNVTDLFTMAGKLYKKQGAGWPVDVIVIEGKGKSALPLPGAIPPRYIDSIERLKDQLHEKAKPNSMDPSGGNRGPQHGGSDMGAQGYGQQHEPSGSQGDTVPSSAGFDQPGGRSGDSGKKPLGAAVGTGDAPNGDVLPATGDGSPGSAGEQSEVSGSSQFDDAGIRGRSPSKGKSDGKKDTGGRRGPGAEHLDGKSDQSLEEELASTSEDDLDDMLADAFGLEKKAKDHVKDATIAGLSGVQNAVKGLGALFTPKNTLSSGFIFNEETYAAAKPHFEAAWADAKQAGYSLKQLIGHLAKQFDAEIVPYLKRFFQDQVKPEQKPQQSKAGKKPKQPPKKQTVTQTQVSYTPSSKSSAIGMLTPVNMAQASKKALKKIEEIHGSVDQFVADELGYTREEVTGKDGAFGYFSGEQVDAIALALHNIKNGAGFIIGDQTGGGKGRVVAAMLRYGMRNGLTPIFITEKPNLYTDMYRDFSDIGMADMADKILITNNDEKILLTEDGSRVLQTQKGHNALLNRIAAAGQLSKPYKVIFTTYNQMNNTGSPRRRFLEQMAKNNGMLVMDESHNAGGTEGDKETDRKLPRSVWFRRLVQSAHSVFYSSATYAKRPGVMNLYSKTDMRLAVDNIDDLGPAIAKGGVPLQQSTATMLVEAGQYVRRERSFEGVEYRTALVEIDKVVAQKISHGLAEIKRFSDKYSEPAIEDLGDQGAVDGINFSDGSAASSGAISSIGFSSVMHNLVNQMLLSLKTEGAIQAAIAAHNAGQKPVITLANTMGSFIQQYADENNLKPNDGIGLTFNDLMINYLDKTRQYSTKDPLNSKKKIKHYLTDAELGEDGVRVYQQIKDLLTGLDLGNMPVSPVDYIISRLAEAGIKADEITGRTDRIEYRPNGVDRYTRRPGSAKSVAGRTSVIYDFNTDKLDALVLNQSGSTGLSLHALPKYEGHDPAVRHMIILQAEGNIDTHMQMLGRIHRAGQVKTPVYTQLVGDIPSEKRPAAVLAGKMASLNANTTAAKDSALTAKETVDFINKYGNRIAAGLMADFPEIHDSMGNPLDSDAKTESKLSEDGAARKVTGRIPLLPLEQQEEIYGLLEEGYKSLIEQLNATGENDLEAKTFDTDARTLKKATVFKGAHGHAGSPFVADAVAEVVDMKKLGKSYSSDEVIDQLKESVYDLKAKDAQKMEKSLDDILSDAEQRHAAEAKDILGRFDDYRTETVDNIENEKRAEATDVRLQGVREDWEYVYQHAQPGNILEVRVGEDYHNMTVLKVSKTGKPKNPLALGTWKVTFAVPDSMRRVTFPFSFLIKMDPKSPGISKVQHMGQVSPAELAKFDRATRTAREHRTIISGNLLAAYGRYKKGRIINFTNSKGVVRQGVLMPADFNLNQEEKDRAIFLNNPKDIQKVLVEGISIKGTKGDVRMFPGSFEQWSNKFVFMPDSGQYTHVEVSVPSSKASGSKYFLNKGLLRAVGEDFIKVKSRMKVTVPIEQVPRILDVLVNQMDEPFQNTTDSDGVRQILGIENVSFDSEDDTQYSTSADTSADLQTPGEGVSLQDLQKRFKGQQVFVSPDGSVSVRLQNGKGLKIVSAKDMGKGDARLAVQTGRMGKNGVILGKYQNQTITLNQDLASNFTRDHELYHFLKDMGMISKGEGVKLIAAMKRIQKNGGLTFKVSNLSEENEANIFAQLLMERENERGTTLGRLIQRVLDFVDGLVHVGRASARKLAREVESGEVFWREARKKTFSNLAQSANVTYPIHKQQGGVADEKHSNVFPESEVRPTSTTPVSRRTVRNVREAAEVLSELSDAAQEEAYLITTGKDGKILETHKYSKGTSNSSSAYAIEMAGHILKKPEAHTVFFAHNHPSGNMTESKADRQSFKNLQALLDIQGVKTKGLIIGNGHVAEFDQHGSDPAVPFPNPKKKAYQNPISERRIIRRKEFSTSAVIKDSKNLKQKLNNREDGILFADNMLMEMEYLRFRKGLSIREAATEILSRAAEINAVHAFMNVQTTENTNRWRLYRPLAAGMKALGISVPDIISRNASGQLISFQEVNKMEPPSIGGIQKMSSDEALYSTSDDIIAEKFHSRPGLVQNISQAIEDNKTEAMDKAIAKSVDGLHFIKKRLGDEPYKMHRMLTGIKSATFSMFLEHGKLAWDNNTLTVKDQNNGVLPFLRSIGDDWQNLFYWTAAKRAEQLEAEGRENWLTEEARKKIFEKTGTHSKKGESWASLNDRFQEFNRNILDVMEESGLIDPESRAVWESNVYIPFYRILEDENSRHEFLTGPRRSKKHISAQIKQLKGGAAKIGDPLENILMNWMHGLDAAARNKARSMAFDVGQEMDNLIEEVPKKDLVKILGSQTIRRYAVMKAGNTRATALMDSKAEAESMAEALSSQGKGEHFVEPRKETRVTFGSMKDFGILSFQREGKPVYFKTEDPDLYEALSEIDTQAFNNLFMRLMGGAKRLLSYSATFGPAFRMRNMIRDTIHTSVVSKSFRPFLDTGIGFVKSMKEDPDYIEFMASGFGFGSSYVNSDDPKTGSRFIKHILKTEGKGAAGRILNTPRKMLGFWEKLGAASENAARLGLYRNMKKKGASNFEAGFEARDLLDFSMRGNAQTVQILTRIVPFLNARVQGLYKLGRSARENPKSFLTKATILTGASLALWALFKDDDRYKELEDWDKWSYYHFWLDKTHYRIPKPFEIGAIFSSLPESVANVMNGTEEGRFVGDWLVNTAVNVFNVDIPQLFKPVLEERFNMDTFRGRPVVPQYMTRLKSSEQYQPWTSDTMRMIGEKFNLSPMKLQHYVNGYFSTIGAMVLAGTDVLTREAMGYPSRTAGRKNPFMLNIMDSNVPTNTRSVSRFYELYDEVDSLNQTFRHYLKTGQGEKARDFLNENQDKILLKKPVFKIRQSLAKVNREIKKIQRSKALSPDQKRRKIDGLNRAKAAITKALFQKIRANHP